MSGSRHGDIAFPLPVPFLVTCEALGSLGVADSLDLKGMARAKDKYHNNVDKTLDFY